jgi:hypothetical protein
VPFPALDPLPHFELSVKEMEPQRFILDTGRPARPHEGDGAGRRSGGLATSPTFGVGQQLTLIHGVADSIRIGEVELRNVPVAWPDQFRLPELPTARSPRAQPTRRSAGSSRRSSSAGSRASTRRYGPPGSLRPKR